MLFVDSGLAGSLTTGFETGRCAVKGRLELGLQIGQPWSLVAELAPRDLAVVLAICCAGSGGRI